MAKLRWLVLGGLVAGGVMAARRLTSIPLVQEVVAGVHAVNLGMGGPVRIGNHVYILENRDGLILIDTAIAKDADDIEAAIQQIGRSISELKVIVITHWHYDHTGSLYELMERAPQAVTYMHPHDREALDGKGGSSYFYGVAGAGEPDGRRVMTQEYPPIPDNLRDRVIAADVEEINQAVAPWGVEAMHTPGHTLGSMSYWHPQERILFPGDALNHMFGAATAPFIHDIYDGAYEQTQQQAVDLADLKPRYILPAHLTINPTAAEWQTSGPRTPLHRFAESVLAVRVKMVRE